MASLLSVGRPQMLALAAMCFGAALGLIRPSRTLQGRVSLKGRVWLSIAVALLVARLVVPLVSLTPWLWVASQIALVGFLIANRSSRGSLVVAAGIVLNALVIAVNRGMPVSVGAARLAGAEAPVSGSNGHIPMGSDSLLGFLGDLLPFPPTGQVLSVGDLFMLAGLAVVSYTAASGSTLPPKMTKSTDEERAEPRRRSVIPCLSTT